MTEPAARTDRSLIENIRNPGVGTLILVACLSFIPLVWPLLLYVGLRYLTGHRSPGSPTWSILPGNQNDATPALEASTSGQSRAARSDGVRYVGAALIAVVAFGVVIAASGRDPAAEATYPWGHWTQQWGSCIYFFDDPRAAHLSPEMDASFCQREVDLLAVATNPSGSRLLMPVQRAVAAPVEAQQANIVGALAAGLGTFFLLIALVRWAQALSANRLLAQDQTMDRRESANVVPMVESKVCPRCAETIKAAALVGRYCGHEFEISAT